MHRAHIYTFGVSIGVALSLRGVTLCKSAAQID
jgi:hypothetical protein